MDNAKYLQAQSFTLAGAGVSLAATTITLNSMLQIDGVTPITMTDLGSKGFATIEPGNGTREEQLSFTGITQNANGTATLTGVSNVLFASPYTETSGTSMSHPGGVILILSNTSGFYNRFTSKNDDETIVGLWDFPSGANNPTIGNITYVAPTTDTQIATKKYVDSVAISGAPNATTSIQGLVQLATQTQVDAKTATGGTGASLVATPALMRATKYNDYVADTGTANTYAIAPAPTNSGYSAGQVFIFLAAHTNTGASTINVNALGTKNIFRDGTALTGGEIVINTLYMVVYDGTQFQLFSQDTTATGVIQMYGGSTAPAGWVFCDGTSYLQATFPSLFAVIGSTYGSADGTHFNVPDFRGRVPLGVGTGTGGGAAGTGLPTGGSALTAVSRGTWKGEETHVLTTTELAAHTHPQQVFTTGSATGIATAGGSPNGTPTAQGLATQAAGSDGAHNNIQPVMGVNFIIKT